MANKEKPRIKAVLFDMNGIIIDDEHIHEMAFKETVKPFGIELDHLTYLDCCAGKTDRAGYEEIAAKFSKDFILALTSSSSRAEVDLIAKEFGIDHEFRITISADDVTKGKPNPEPYL